MSREKGERKRWERVRVGEWCESGGKKGLRVGIELELERESGDKEGMGVGKEGCEWGGRGVRVERVT